VHRLQLTHGILDQGDRWERCVGAIQLDGGGGERLPERAVADVRLDAVVGLAGEQIRLDDPARDHGAGRILVDRGVEHQGDRERVARGGVRPNGARGALGSDGDCAAADLGPGAKHLVHLGP
jgi:hypothetical protein